MKKKIFVIMMIMSMGLLVAGCSNSNGKETGTTDKVEEEEVAEEEPETRDAELNDEKEEEIEETTDEVKDDSEYIDYTGMIPDPEETFTIGNYYLLQGAGDKYIFQIENYSDDEFDAYISKCKEMGFSKVKYESSLESGKQFGAYSEDGEYFVEAFTTTVSNNVYVTFEKAEDAE